MSSVLAMVLATVTASGPEWVSAETERGLDLRGEWEGLWCVGGEVKIFNGHAMWNLLLGVRGKACTRSGTLICLCEIIDEGNSRLRGWCNVPDTRIHGIYRQERDHLEICFRPVGKQRPTSFHSGDGQYYLILRRVKLGK